MYLNFNMFVCFLFCLEGILMMLKRKGFVLLIVFLLVMFFLFLLSVVFYWVKFGVYIEYVVMWYDLYI